MDDQLLNEVVLGVDTHLDVNVAAVINHTGKLLGTFSAEASARGYLELVAWHVHWAVFDVLALRALDVWRRPCSRFTRARN